MLEDLRFSSGQKMQLDIYLAQANLAFEYQGEHHFYDVPIFGPSIQYSERDMEKRKACQQKGITLIEIPYWWDFELESLKATIHSFRPDLLSKPAKGAPIPNVPEEKKGKEAIFGFLNFLGASLPPLALAQYYDGTEDLQGW